MHAFVYGEGHFVYDLLDIVADVCYCSFAWFILSSLEEAPRQRGASHL